MCQIIPSANKSNLISTFPIYSLLISISCLIALARNSSTVLNKSGKNRHPYLVLDFKENGFCFFPIWYDAGYRFVIYSLHYVEARSFFYHEGMLSFCQRPFQLRWSCEFCSSFCLCAVYFIYVEPILHPWNETNLPWCILFHVHKGN
jgi:hypothetical protein